MNMDLKIALSGDLPARCSDALAALAPELGMVPAAEGVPVCCFSERMRKLFRKNEKNVLRFCNKKAKEKRRLQRVKKPM